MLFSMQNLIHFEITKGDDYYCASAREFSIVTQAKTLDELLKNITEATELHMESINEDLTQDWAKDPSLMLNFEVPLREHART